ncbi:MAG: tetratricopeptide repeat protein [Ginsengibacter sp.]
MKIILSSLLVCFLAISSFAQNADSATFYFAKAKNEIDAKHYAVASKLLDKATIHNPSMVEAFLLNGKVNMEMSRVYEAGQYFNKAHELQPSNSIVTEQLMLFNFNNGQSQKAIALAQQCGSCAQVEKVLGMSYYKAEDYGKAEKYLNTAIQKNDNDAQVIYTLGRTYLELENEKKAIPLFEKAIALEPGKNNWMNELGLIYYNQSNYKNAVKYFNLAAEAGLVKNNDFIENLAFAQLYTGDADNAMKNLNVILEKKPNNTQLMNDIAFAMYSTKRYEGAIEYYQKLLTVNPKDASSLFMAGMTFQKMGQKEKGQKICDKAIEMDPSLAKNRQKQDMPMGL